MTMKYSEPPELLAKLLRKRTTYAWEVDCPHCGRKHLHGGGPLTDDPRKYLGHRLSHCDTGFYTLIEV